MNRNFFTKGAEKPNRAESERDEYYDAKMARWCCSSGMDQRHNNFLDMADVNIRFWKNDQWIFEEDTEAFMKDEDGNVKNRIKTVDNKIYPIVAQYLGNARNLDLSFKAVNTSPDVINRRESRLSELLFLTELANASAPGFKAYIRENYPVGETMQETETMFDNNWIDSLTESVNLFCTEVANINEIDKYKEELAFYLSLTGLSGFKYDFHNGDYIIAPLDVFSFWWDRSSKRRDLSDSMFMGECEAMSPEDILERYNPNEVYKKAITDSDYQDDYNGRKIIVKSYWRDYEKQRYGWVRDPFDYPFLVRLDYDLMGTTYTDKDLIPESELEEAQIKVLNGNNEYIYDDYLRYAHVLPSEFIKSTSMPYDPKSTGDIVLEHGVWPYQETDLYKMWNIKFPYKPCTWYYEDGVVHTPVSMLINPQRVINRMNSVQDNIVNTSMPKNFMYDPEMVDDEAEFLSNFYQGKPNAVTTKGLGIHNLAGEVGTGIDSSVNVLAQLSDVKSQSMDRMIGVNESLRGESQGANKLVGVTALEIQRGSLSQEGFYGALESVYKQTWESIANVARKVYAENERELAIMVGDRYAETLKISKEYNLEEFRIHVQRTVDPKQAKMLNQQKLTEFTMAGLISKPILAKYYQNPSDDDVADALREQAVIDTEMAKMQQQAQKQEAEMIEKEQAVQEARADVSEQNNMMLEKDSIDQKREATVAKLAENQRTKDGNG